MKATAMRAHWHFIICVIAAAVLPANLLFAASITDFADFSLRDSAGNDVLPGRIYVPPEASLDPSTPRPFLLFLHGAGEDGTNNTSQINSNIDNLLAEAKLKGAYLYARKLRVTGAAAHLPIM